MPSAAVAGRPPYQVLQLPLCFQRRGLSQAADVGRRFVIELESGKETIQIGKFLKVIDTLGMDLSLTGPEEI